MAKCKKCGKEIGMFNTITHTTPEGNKIAICEACKQKIDEERIDKEIKCPYCGKWFKKVLEESHRVSEKRNVNKSTILIKEKQSTERLPLQKQTFKFCPYCANKLDGSPKFCIECGNKL